MRYVCRFALAVFSFVSLSVATCGAQSPIPIPKDGEGYQLTKSETSQAAPAGYEGRTDTLLETAVGNNPSTAGKRIVVRFTLGNQIKKCPNVDGTAEGTGEFSLSLDYTEGRPDGTSKTHIEMMTKAKYKGQVGDNALLQGPVNAEIDYTYNQTGSFRDLNGAISSSPPANIQQHITIPVMVAPDMGMPSFGTFTGGDPTQGHYGQAFSTGMALAFWGGVYYSFAELNWYGGKTSDAGGSPKAGACVQVDFDPPANTLQPPLGSEAKVNATLKTLSGEVVPGNFVEAYAFQGGSVTVQNSQSAVGTPAQFVYSAPSVKAQSAGFQVGVFSRAGTAIGQWKTVLGTGWSGQITYQKTLTGDQGHTDLQTWSSTSTERITIQVKDGLGTFQGFVEENNQFENRQPVALGGGQGTFKVTDTSSSIGSGSGVMPTKIEVSIDEPSGTYTVRLSEVMGSDRRPMPPPAAIGKSNWTSCIRSDCKSGQRDIGMPGLPMMGPMSGKVQDPNHIQGSYTYRKDQLGHGRTGVMVETLTVNLARSGKTNTGNSKSSKK